MKQCPDCKQTLPSTSFSRCRNGLYAYCKDCSRERSRAWARKNPEQRRRHRKAYNWRRRTAEPMTEETQDFLAVIEGDVCAYCGGPAATVDHIVALSAGGENQWTNLTAACSFCNTSKKANSLLRFLLTNATEPGGSQA